MTWVEVEWASTLGDSENDYHSHLLGLPKHPRSLLEVYVQSQGGSESRWDDKPSLRHIELLVGYLDQIVQQVGRYMNMEFGRDELLGVI